VVTPFDWRQVRPAHAPGGQVFTVVLHHAEKCFIGFGDRAFKIPHDNPHDVGFDQTPDLGFQPLCQFTDFCLRFFALGHLKFEVLRLIR